MSQPIAIVGGTGFVGQHIACELGRSRRPIRILTRRRERDRELLVIPNLELVEADVHSAAALSDALEGCSAVINLVGILHAQPGERGSFRAVHAELPAKVAEAARFNGITRMVQMSALGAASDAPSEYLRTKAAGEAALAEVSGLELSVFRPSVIFGPEDNFINSFGEFLRLAPLVFPLGCPDARFAPVFVDDVARAFVHALDEPSTIGQTYELCGPREYTLQQLVEYTARTLGLRRYVLGLGDGLSRLQASVLGMLPRPPMTLDNYHSLQVPSVCTDNGFGRLGITPASLESVVPGYLGRRGREKLYTTLRSSAGRD